MALLTDENSVVVGELVHVDFSMGREDIVENIVEIKEGEVFVVMMRMCCGDEIDNGKR